jgi:hypothetical protein
MHRAIRYGIASCPVFVRAWPRCISIDSASR